MQGEEILKKQKQISNKRAELTQARKAKEDLLKEREDEKTRLEQQEKEQKALVNNLRKKQRSLQSEISKKRKEANQLNARIDRLIAEEIEKARKRAEEEARREAAARKKAGGKSEAASSDRPKATPLETYTMNKADRQLSGTFANNRGNFLYRLPVLISLPVITANIPYPDCGV